MSVERETPTTGGETERRSLSIKLPPDHRFRVVVETALRIYLRPICRGGEPAPQLADELAAMIDEVADREPVEWSSTAAGPRWRSLSARAAGAGLGLADRAGR
jgi:hypothetical protein